MPAKTRPRRALKRSELAMNAISGDWDRRNRVWRELWKWSPKRRTTVLLLTFAVLLLAVSTGVMRSPVLVQAQDRSSASLPAATRTKIDAIFSDFNRQTPGCVLGVVRNGGLVYTHGYGMARLEENVPLTPQSVLEIGSVSKQFTAASIFLLEHEGKLSLDDDVRKYVAEFPAYDRPVTIRELLHHTSGVRDVISLMSMSGIPFDDFASESDALAMIARQRELNFEPNSRYMYSNSGYVLLSQIVKRVSGMPLAQFAEKNIFIPLGMTHTLIVDDHTLVIPGRSGTYARQKSEGGFEVDMSNWEQTGDGAVDTTVGDLARWDRNFDHPVVGGKWLIDELETQGTLNNGKKIDYAAGLVIGTYRGLRTVSHGGAWQGFRAQFERFPNQGTTLITLCNVANANPGARTDKVADILLGSKMTAIPRHTRVSLSDDQLRQYAGLYWSEPDRDVRRVEFRDHTLFLHPALGPEIGLVPLGDGEFGLGPDLGNAILLFTHNGGRQQMVPPGGDEALDRVEPADLTEDQMRTAAGIYRSDELQVTWSVALEGGKLVLHAEGANPNKVSSDNTYELVAAIPNVFTAGPYVVQFDSDGMRVSVGRAGGIRFVKTP
jgi:CubicO group peptidase (beta-lactamase class C family)